MRTAAAVLCMRGKILPRPRRNELTEIRIKKRVSVPIRWMGAEKFFIDDKTGFHCEAAAE